MTDSFDRAGSERVRSLFDGVLADEPPLLDMVADAVAGSRRRKRRDRLAVAVVPLAVVALASSAYEVLPGSGDGGHVTAAMSSVPGPTFPPPPTVLRLEPPLTISAAAKAACALNWTITRPPGSQMVPRDATEARSICEMTVTELGALLPDAQIKLAPRYGTRPGPAQQWDFNVTTAAGATDVQIVYVWPDTVDSAADKLGEVNCNRLVAPSQPSLHDPGTTDLRTCKQIRPSARFPGELSVDSTAQSVSYRVDDLQGGLLSVSTGPTWVDRASGTDMLALSSPTPTQMPLQAGDSWTPVSPYRPAYPDAKWTSAFLDPRFGDFVTRFSDFILMR